MMMSEIDAVVQVLHKKCNRIYKKQPITDNDKGDVGEIFCKYGVKQVFLDRGFYAISGSSKTFTIEEQINPTLTGMGGIDFSSKFNINSKKYNLFVEMKNWGYYQGGISYSTYKSEILDRFMKNDPQRKRYWILAINKRHIKDIGAWCKNDTINVIPIDAQILSGNINPKTLKPIFKNFIIDFSILVDDIISGKVQP